MKTSLDWRARITVVSERFDRYRTVVGWMLRDLWRFGRSRLLLVLAASFLSRTLLNSTLVLLIFYLKALESGSAGWLQYLPQGVTVRDLFWPVAVAGSALYISSSLIDFAVARRVIDISARHSVDLSRRCLTMFAPALPGPQRFGSRHFPGDTVWLSTSGSDIMARASRTILRSVSPLFQFLYAAVMLLVMEPLAAVVVALISFPPMLLAYFINSSIVRDEHILTVENRRRKHAAADLAQTIAVSGNDVSGHDRHEVTDAATGVFAEVARLRAERVTHREKSRTLSNLIVGIGLLFVLALLGYEALTGSRTWAVVIGFIVLLRVAGNALGGLLGSGAYITRLYPVLRRFPLYLRDPAALPARPFPAVKIRNTLGLGDRQRLVIQPGCVYHMYADVPLGRLNLWYFVYFLAGGKGPLAAALLEQTVLLAEETALPEDAPATGSRELPRPVLVPARLRHRLGDTISVRFPGACLIVCHDNFRQALSAGERGEEEWIVPARDGQIGLCTSAWLAGHFAEIEAVLRRKAASVESEDDEDEDEE